MSTDRTPSAPFTELVNLASRLLGAGLVATNEDTFADAENLLVAKPAEFRAHTFGHKGQIMDGWESKRRRGVSAEQPHPTDEDHDWAVVRLGVGGVIRGVIVDTAHFTGNYPETASVQAASIPGHPSVEELDDAGWTDLVPRTALRGDTAHEFEVTDGTRYTHVRLNIWPDGGVARLRVHGEVLPDPRELDGLTFDLAAQEYGGVAEAASDRYFSSPHNLNAPGRASVMGEGWETRRRRDKANDWVRIALAGGGEVLAAEVDTTHFVANAPGWADLVGYDASTGGDPSTDTDGWFPVLPRTRLQPDTRHRLRLDAGRPVTHVRINVYPDGGLARLRLTGRLTGAGRAALALRWFNALPADEARTALVEAGLEAEEASALTAARPLADAAATTAAVSALQPADGPDGEQSSRRRSAIWRLLGV
ncbi:putative allantoicase [Kitasatospora herbaricolor]|uniref:allantoicase n=1 Tax=Kitasatospora herbaricolor TaxID=68217 RepID=UPI00174D4843|nr:allantoicase [Kitasatospora herbaricolor]MDQ0311736.1 allantoicase [Kitasatospora herbaricolor]GGU96215.1 putative allantoicase [Kitasatospora herbaricolor]